MLKENFKLPYEDKMEIKPVVVKRFLTENSTIVDDAFISTARLPEKDGFIAGFCLHDGSNMQFLRRWIIKNREDYNRMSEECNTIKDKISTLLSDAYILVNELESKPKEIK